MKRGQFRNLGNASALAGGIIDATTAPIQQVTLDQAATQFSVRNLKDGEILFLLLTQDAVGGRTATFNGAGGMTITNPPAVTEGPNRTYLAMFCGSNAQNGGAGIYAGGAGNGESTQQYVNAANNRVTMANDATTPDGISLDVLANDNILTRIGGLGCYFIDLGPGNVPQFSTLTDAVALRIRGPGWAVANNASLELLTGSSALHANNGALDLVSYENTIGITLIQNMLLERDAPAGLTYLRRIKGRSSSSGAVTSDIKTYTPADGRAVKITASVVVSNDTDNEGGMFMDIVGCFQRVGGVTTQVGATVVNATPSRLPASIGAAAIAFVVASPNVILRGTGVAAKDIVWQGYVKCEEVPIV